MLANVLWEEAIAVTPLPVDSLSKAAMQGSHLVDATFAKHDENGDGTLSLEEFTGTPISPPCTGHFALLLSRCVAVQQRW